jgi:DNA repair protein RadC
MKVPIKKVDKVKVSGSLDIYPIMQRVLKRENKIARQKEHVWVVGLDKDNVILYIELLGLGSYYSVPVDTPSILRMAIYKLADSIILVHNHPSGTLKPSDADIDITEFIKHGGYFTNIKLADHLIINEKEYFSFLDNKLLKPYPKPK